MKFPVLVFTALLIGAAAACPSQEAAKPEWNDTWQLGNHAAAGARKQEAGASHGNGPNQEGDFGSRGALCLPTQGPK